MPKHKHYLSSKKPSKTGKKRDPEPGTANEYLAVGVGFEEAGEKWRAGDAAKSLRFFVRAIDGYDAGLQRFPNSSDLAYNKARLQYELAQQPRLLRHLPTPLTDLLQLALDSHNYALSIDQDNADLLFNTAQVLTSLAEVVSEGKKVTKASQDQALRLLHEALELFQRCLNVQEILFTQAEVNAAQTNTASEDLNPKNEENVVYEPTQTGEADSTSDQEVWASIEQPITKQVLLDTVIAQLETVSALCTLQAGQNADGLAWIEEYFRSTLQDRIATYGTANLQEAALARAKFVCGMSDAAFRSGRLELSTYEQELSSAFRAQELNLEEDPRSLCDRADAELTFNASVEASLRASKSSPSPEELNQINATRWKRITKALNSLTAAANVLNAQNLPSIHVRRGDCELLRFRLGSAPSKYELAIKSAQTLLKNANIFYRAAILAAGSPRSLERVATDEQRELIVKEAVAACLVGDDMALSDLVRGEREVVEQEIENMREEGLLGDESVQRICELFI